MDKHDNIIDDIENARVKNNVNWMSILRIAMKHAPEETKEILMGIYNIDSYVCKKVNELINED